MEEDGDKSDNAMGNGRKATTSTRIPKTRARQLGVERTGKKKQTARSWGSDEDKKKKRRPPINKQLGFSGGKSTSGECLVFQR